MNTRMINGLLRMSAGMLDDVDLVNRTIQVRVGPTALSFDVPRECEILLNGERVMLHVLQVRDPVRVFHGPGFCDCAAKRIEVVSQQHRRRSFADDRSYESHEEVTLSEEIRP